MNGMWRLIVVGARRTGLLLFPGLVAAIAVVPVIAFGPLAFAIRRDFEFTNSDVGIAYAAFFLFSALLTGMGGSLAARFDTLRVIRGGLLCSAGVSVALAFATSGPYLMVVCGIAGAINGLITPSTNILITTSAPSQHRGLSFGVKVAAVPAASSLAAIGAYGIAEIHSPWQAVYWFCAILACAVVALSALFKPMCRSRPTSIPGRPHGGGGSRYSLTLLAIGGLLGAAGTAVLPPFLVDGLMSRGLDHNVAAAILAFCGWLGIAARVVVGAVSDRGSRNPAKHLRAASAMLLTGFVGMFGLSVGETQAVLVAAALITFGIGWSWPGLLHHSVMTSHPLRPALATSYMQTGTFVGAVVGPLGFGLLADHVSYAVAWGVSAGVVLAAAAFLFGGARQLRCSRET
ncbi:MFS transporter [Arthrobacter sp. NPDC093128]|uniref:MFS transporter n=1 Tax=Arthrobacter sp. NPDC093128 TaxID=3154979 RepID=UPI0034308A7D